MDNIAIQCFLLIDGLESSIFIIVYTEYTILYSDTGIKPTDDQIGYKMRNTTKCYE